MGRIAVVIRSRRRSRRPKETGEEPVTTRKRAPAPRARADERGRRERATSISRTRTVSRWSVAFPGRESRRADDFARVMLRPGGIEQRGDNVERQGRFLLSPGRTSNRFASACRYRPGAPRLPPLRARTTASITPRTSCELSHFGSALSRPTPTLYADRTPITGERPLGDAVFPSFSAASPISVDDYADDYG